MNQSIVTIHAEISCFPNSCMMVMLLLQHLSAIVVSFCQCTSSTCPHDF